MTFGTSALVCDLEELDWIPNSRYWLNAEHAVWEIQRDVYGNMAPSNGRNRKMNEIEIEVQQ